jgi:hypothetical protein
MYELRRTERPFRGSFDEGLTRDKPWAMLYCPLRATDWNIQKDRER